MNSCDQNYEEQRHSVAVAMLPGAAALGGATPRSFDPDKPPGKGKDDDGSSDTSWPSSRSGKGGYNSVPTHS